MNRLVALTLVLAFVLFGAMAFSKPGLDLRPYPEAAVTYMEPEGLWAEPHRVAHMDFVGNYLELRYGRRASVFIDDRYDMYPTDIPRDYLRLLRARPESLRLLDDRRVDVVLWAKDDSLPNLLTLSGRWREIHADETWVVLRRVD